MFTLYGKVYKVFRIPSQLERKYEKYKWNLIWSRGFSYPQRCGRYFISVRRKSNTVGKIIFHQTHFILSDLIEFSVNPHPLNVACYTGVCEIYMKGKPQYDSRLSVERYKLFRERNQPRAHIPDVLFRTNDTTTYKYKFITKIYIFFFFSVVLWKFLHRKTAHPTKTNNT